MDVIFTYAVAGDQINKNEMGGACGTYGRAERFWCGNLSERTTWETQV